MSFLYFIIPGLCIALSTWIAIKAVKRGANKKKAVALQICSTAFVSLMCFIMPAIVIIIAATIFLFLYAIDDARHQGVGYAGLYAYRNDEMIEGVTIGDGEISCAYLGEDSSYGIQRKCYIYSTEYGVRTGRLRRWQLYGDVLSEQGN